MPIYEYQCAKCGHTFEELVFSADAAPACPRCGAPGAKKLISACAVRPAGNGSGLGSLPSDPGGSCGGHGGFS